MDTEMVYLVQAVRVTKDKETPSEEVIMQTRFVISESAIPTENRIKDALRMCIDAGVLNRTIDWSDVEDFKDQGNGGEDLWQ